jgi:hypothetical protein
MPYDAASEAFRDQMVADFRRFMLQKPFTYRRHQEDGTVDVTVPVENGLRETSLTDFEFQGRIIAAKDVIIWRFVREDISDTIARPAELMDDILDEDFPAERYVIVRWEMLCADTQYRVTCERVPIV